MSETVLVTQTEYRKAEDVFRAAGDLACEAASDEEAGLANALVKRGARAAIVGVAPYRGALYEALGRARGIIARFGVGCDHIDRAQARQHGVVVANTPGTLDASVAEHAIWLLGCLARHIARLHARTQAGEFAGEMGMELNGKTLGILGFGKIGRRVAAIAHFGLGMEVIAVGARSAAELEAAERRTLADILSAHGASCYTNEAAEAFGQCDALSIHLPVTAKTEQFLNAERLSWLKPGALLVNTARGALVDETALYDALADGRLGGAALDVFAVEPYQPAHPAKDLRRLENVALTPHIGSNTEEANARMARAALDNVRHFLAGRLDRVSRIDL